MRLDIVVVISFWVGTFTHTNGVHCFIVPHPKTKLKVWKPLQVVQQEEDRAVVLTEEVNATPSRGVSAGASTNTANTVNDEATRLRKEAEMIRLQAEKMDLSLTLDKISSLESKLQNKSWLAKHPEKEQELRDQLQRLNDKLRGPNDEPQTTAAPTKERSEFKISEDRPELRMSSMSPTRSTSSSLPTEQSDVGRKDASWRGFVESEIELYLPVIARIERDVPNNATIDEKVESFKRAPELQDYFRSKIENLLSIPLEEAFKIEDLKDQYLESTSTKERENLKRQIDRIEGGELVGPFKDPDPKGYYCDYLTPLSDEEVKKRAASIATLPDTLIAIYMKGKGLEFDVDDLETAVLYEYYEPQLQLLEKPRYVEELTHDEKEGYKMGYQSLPKSIRDRFAEKLGLPPDSTSDDVLEKVVTETGRLSSLINFSQPSSSENRDIEYIDRSRYLSELFTNIASMEADRPSEEDVKLFATDILDNKFFMLSSKPERVSGGYYIRGTNRLADDDGSSSNTGSLSAGDRLVAQIQERLDKSPLAEKLQFYYIMDPSPPYDEEIELAIQKDPILVVTGKNSSILYDTNEPKIKGIISSAGVFAAFLYAVGACVLNPTIADRFDQSINAVASTGVLDLQWFGDVFFPLFLGLGATQLVHEAAHRIVAAYYKFDVGVPNIIPSPITGIAGAITPLKSPPPNSKALFDFALAGPAAGFIFSLIMMIYGLGATAATGLDSAFPAIPVDLLRSSSLGGGLVSSFLGSGFVIPNQGLDSLVGLHPLAIAGFLGLIINSLALLPLGHTDGGRIALTMFGRRGTVIVSFFTAVGMFVAGLLDRDPSDNLLFYALLAMIWQRQLEVPPTNETDELDFGRGLLGIAAAIVVGLTLIPMS